MSDFPQLKDQTYLDNAGSLPIPKPILEKYNKDLMTNLYGNPHSLSQSSIQTTNKILSIRKMILEYLNTNERDWPRLSGMPSWKISTYDLPEEP